MSQDKLINYLKTRNIVIVSPHLDDAILSTGMLLYELKNYKNVTVINCFTNAHIGPYTLSARKALKNSNNTKDATLLYNERVNEDKKALDQLNIKIINLNLEDALFRRKKQTGISTKLLPELNHVYPTYRWHIIKSISSKDHAMDELKILLKKNIKKDTVIFAPYGIGNHVDHQIARIACEKLFTDIILYSDFPYNIGTHYFGDAKNGQHIYKLNTMPEEKK